MKISVVITSARRTEDTTYAEWFEVTRAFLRRHYADRLFRGEFASLLAALQAHAAPPGETDKEKPHTCHITYQLRALAMQTRLPDEVVVVSPHEDVRNACVQLTCTTPFPFLVRAVTPRNFQHEPREPGASYECGDKNTGIVAARYDNLLMLDDCCLPGFALVEYALATCERGNIAMIGHQQCYLPIRYPKPEDAGDVLYENNTMSVGHCNWHAATPSRVFGIWAMPKMIAFALNGFDTTRDGGARRGADVELLSRADLYVKQHRAIYVYHPTMRVYELGHDTPWAQELERGRVYSPDSFQAPGPSLAELAGGG